MSDEAPRWTTANIRRAANLFDLALSAAEAELATQFLKDASRAVATRRNSFKPPLDLYPATGYQPFSVPTGASAEAGNLHALTEWPRAPHSPHASAEGSQAAPAGDLDLLFLPLLDQLHLLRSGALSPQRLIHAARSRLESVNPAINAVVTMLDLPTVEQNPASGHDASPTTGRVGLSGVPYGAKDLFDTAGIETSFGAAPFRGRIPDRDAAVVARCRNAGAVLLAKLSLGELAMGDEWFGGRTNNPWNTEHGAGGSSAGSAAAVATGALSFALGTETSGSIITPSMRCGVVGLRPTFGRVARTGAMPLSWSFDKIGPITRHPRDAGVVLSAITGQDDGDPDSVENTFPSVADEEILGSSSPHFTIGYMPRWFDTREATTDSAEGPSAVKSALIKHLETDERFTLRTIEIPQLPYKNLAYLLLADAAAVFEDLTLSGGTDLLARQGADSWPNTFRASHLLSAVEYVQLQRFRRHCVSLFDSLLSRVDMLIAPAYADQGDVLVLTTATGHPSLTFPIGFTSDGLPDSLTLWGRAYDEATMIRAAEVIMEHFNLQGARPLT
ncbi:MAG: amidase [Spirochaetes bacterium]|jgi:Asp-tRNA(Asn)/Glu-tRNA(Gln) amidotransferase A subunit family amidase|nr:amidase [Spirochaetota bacterium]